jgi:hypothetical protein
VPAQEGCDADESPYDDKTELSENHNHLVAGDPPNALLSFPDDRILSLVALLRDTPMPAPASL